MRRNSSRASASAVRGVVAAVAASVVALTSLASGVAVVPPVRGQALAAEVTTAADWTLLYAEDFSTPLDEAGAQWVWESYSNPFDTIMDDSGLWYQNDYGPDWYAAFNSFATYRKEFRVGQDGWLTASLSARDWDKDGVIEAPPSISIRVQPNECKPSATCEGGGYVAVLDVPDYTGGAIFRPTNKLPSQYRVEYKLKTIDFGGKRHGSIEYDGRVNGYSTEGCKTQHPWGEGSNSPGWTGDASVPLCEWQDVREGPYGYNGFHFLSIVDFANPAPRNNHFWHYRRKVLMDSFSQHPDRVGGGTGGRVCDSDTNQYYSYRDSSFNTVNMWISGLPNWTPGPGGLAGNSQWFMTSCSGGIAERQLSSAAELQPELMPDEFYVFAIERNTSGYTLEASGNFARVGRKTLRFHRPFIVDDAPIWHYNNAANEYDGRFNGRPAPGRHVLAQLGQLVLGLLVQGGDAGIDSGPALCGWIHDDLLVGGQRLVLSEQPSAKSTVWLRSGALDCSSQASVPLFDIASTSRLSLLGSFPLGRGLALGLQIQLNAAPDLFGHGHPIADPDGLESSGLVLLNPEVESHFGHSITVRRHGDRVNGQSVL